MALKMGVREFSEESGFFGALRDANDILDDPPLLRSRLADDGYLFIRRLHDPARVLEARRVVLENLAANGQLDTNRPLDEAVLNPAGARGAFLGGAKAVTHAPEFLDVVESPGLLRFFSDLLGADAITFDYKWLRAVGPGDSTGAHFDVVYMGRGTRNLLTLWTPLGNVSLREGPLALLVGSHTGAGYQRIRETYGEMDVDRDHVTGSFSDDPAEMVEKYGGQWQTAEFCAGDAILFGMFTMHGSLTNQTDHFRLSCDTRYQRADEPADERWVGENPKAHYGWMSGDTVTMEEARKQWKL